MLSTSSERASALGLVLSLLATVEARSIAVRDNTPVALNPPSFDGWKYMGCWSDTQSSRTLAIPAHFGEHVDNDNCIYQCIQLGHIFSAVEYSGQCYCGDYVNPIAVQEPETDCYMPCTKTATQACGGPDRMTMYYLEGATPATPPATVGTNPGVDGWVSEGCYSDQVGARTLANQVQVTGSMTVALCVDACHAAGYSLAGVEYAGQCYCDNVYTNGSPGSTNCNMACDGNLTEYCGGPGALNLYSYGGATPVLSVAPTPTAVTPTNVALPSAWATLGCYTDNVGARALTHGMNIASMTVDKCIAACAAAGYTISGLEYGGECYCDSKIQNNQGIASDGSAGCNMPCAGNAAEMCGGSNRLNVYAAGPAWVQLGCYSDQTYSRTLITTGAYTGDLTIEKCQASCAAAGYVYSGVEYSTECHCGNAFLNGGGPASDGNVGCSWTCAGDSTEICGGNSRLSMYEYINAAGVVNSVSPTTTPTIQASTPSTTATPTAVSIALPTGWSYAGCYVDNAQGRIFATQEPDTTTNTISSCISICASLGYSIAGTEYSSQCFCDNYVRNAGVLAASDSQCAMTCSGDASQVCGGPDRLSVYSTSAPVFAPVPVVKKTELPGTWTYKGCFADSIGQRDTGVTGMEVDSATEMTAEFCLSQCTALGFNAGGMEYTSQCYCGTVETFEAVNPAELSESMCNMACSGDSMELCGGAGAISFYTAA